MANEQTSVPLYASSEILTAANMNISAGTGVPVFATTVTRDAAFGGASEKVLAEGQLCYLSSTNVVQYYDGAAWATVGPAAASGLTFITGGTVTSSTSANFDNVFSATYDNYRLIISDITSASGGEVGVNMRMRVGGVNATGSNYNSQYARVYTTGTSAPLGEVNGSSGMYIFAVTTSAANTAGAAVIDITQPFLAKPTVILCTSHTFDPAASHMGNAGGGSHSVQTSYDGFNIYQTTTTSAYKYKLYGYSNS